MRVVGGVLKRRRAPIQRLYYYNTEDNREADVSAPGDNFHTGRCSTGSVLAFAGLGRRRGAGGGQGSRSRSLGRAGIGSSVPPCNANKNLLKRNY